MKQCVNFGNPSRTKPTSHRFYSAFLGMITNCAAAIFMLIKYSPRQKNGEKWENFDSKTDKTEMTNEDSL